MDKLYPIFGDTYVGGDRRKVGHLWDKICLAVTLIAASIAATTRGVYVWQNPEGMQTYGKLLVETVAPQGWAFAWGLCALLCLLGLFSPNMARAGLAIFTSMWLTWGVSYMASWWIYGSPTGAWSIATAFLCFGVLSGNLLYMLERRSRFD